MTNKLRGFNPWQLTVLLTGAFGVLLGVAGSFLEQRGLMITGLGVAVLSTPLLTLLFSRQTWRQLKRLDSKVNAVSSEGLSPMFVTAPAKLNNDRPSESTAQILSKPCIGLDNEWARRMPHIRANIETFALRSKSTRIRNAITLAATERAYRYAELREILIVADMGMLDRSLLEVVRAWDKDMLLTLARLAANQRAVETDMEDAARLFNLVERYFGSKALGRNDRLIYIEVLTEIGELKRQREAIKRFGIKNKFPVQAALLRLNSVGCVDNGISERWVEELNLLFEKNGLAKVELVNQTGLAAIDRLRSTASDSVEGPLVSVLVPSYQGGELLRTALNSLLEQTWENIEIIVVDDCSGPEYEKYLLEAEMLSPKIKVIRQSQNLGAYCARNAALSVAEGEFVTVHDDDDWSHPDKIAIQAKHLIANPQVPGNMSLHARSTDELKFLRINNNPQFTQPNFSSLMVRRTLFGKIGVWDTVNRGADAEFRDRIVTRFGKAVESVGVLPMSFTRTRDGSLTSGEMSRGYVDPSRLLYLASYTKWHNRFHDNRNLLTRGAEREYTVPSTMEAGRRGADLGTFDVIYATDFRFPGGTTTLTLAEMRAVSRAGKRVGFIQLESPLNKPSSAISETLLDLQANAVVEQVSLGDIAQAHVLIARHPTVVTFLERATSRITAEHALLIVNNPPVNKGGTGMVFDLETCIDNMDRLFGTTTMVVGESELTRKISVPLVRGSRMSDSTWPGVITSYNTRTPDFSKKPVLGRHSRDHGLKWPSTAETFKQVYVSDRYSTEILGGSKELCKKLGSDITRHVKVHEYGSMEVDEFLNKIDFWSYFHDDQLTESFGMSTAEAMAAGKVVILPKYMETTFGDGAVYAEPREVSKLIQLYWNDPDLYISQAEKARLYVQSRYGVDALMKRIDRLADDRTTAVA